MNRFAKLFYTFSALVLFVSLSPAQSIDLDLFKNMSARSIGPAGMSGRVTSIDVVHKSPEIIYVGTASGGLWKSTSGGTEWEPIFDEQEVASIGAVAIDQQNPAIIWAGTGEEIREIANPGSRGIQEPRWGKDLEMYGPEGNTFHPSGHYPSQQFRYSLPRCHGSSLGRKS